MNRIIRNGILKIGVLGLATAGFAAADSYSGELVAARCTFESDGAKAHSPEGCSPTASTNVFGVRMPDGTVLRFDDAGNQQAAAALKEDPRRQTVTVSGSLDGKTLKVDSIEIH